MKRYLLHEPFNIYHFLTDTWQHPLHNHAYYEIICILKGKGIHQVNENHLPYSKGNVFLLGPEDYHAFEIHHTTDFLYLRFTENYVRDIEQKHKAEWKQIVNRLLHNAYGLHKALMLGSRDQQKFFELVLLLASEYEAQTAATFQVIRDGLMKAIVSLLARNVQTSTTISRNAHHSSIEEMLTFIRQHIHQNDQLRIQYLAEKFNFAPNYISLYFKKQTGESLKDYITRYRLKTVETRLRYSQLTISQIAHELGFTDESHLSKQFKKYYGLSPRQYRTQLLSAH
jgi:AraC family L-rhamnose operon regulatory protein RhaS